LADSPEGLVASNLVSHGQRVGFVDLLAVHALAVDRLSDGITVSGRGVALAMLARICIGHAFLTRDSSHAICVPITQRLSASSTDHPARSFFLLAPSFSLILIYFARPHATEFISSPGRIFCNPSAGSCTHRLTTTAASYEYLDFRP